MEELSGPAGAVAHAPSIDATTVAKPDCKKFLNMVFTYASHVACNYPHPLAGRCQASRRQLGRVSGQFLFLFHPPDRNS
jgi:hypothetical protein